MRPGAACQEPHEISVIGANKAQRIVVDDQGTTMKEQCDVCGKEAIGIQCLGCCASTVCAEHAEPMLRELQPGEKKEWGACYYYRFPEDAENR